MLNIEKELQTQVKAILINQISCNFSVTFYLRDVLCYLTEVYGEVNVRFQM